MSLPLPAGVIRQKDWTVEELLAHGFQRFARKKQVVMVRVLPADEAPLTVRWPLETMTLEAGYFVCYDPGEGIRPTLKDYSWWGVRPDMFALTYKAWDVADWKPSPAEANLMRLGCKPYYKSESIWALRLTETTLIQSVESKAPVPVPAGNWLGIGALGEPWYIADDTIKSRYNVIAP